MSAAGDGSALAATLGTSRATTSSGEGVSAAGAISSSVLAWGRHAGSSFGRLLGAGSAWLKILRRKLFLTRGGSSVSLTQSPRSAVASI